MIIATANSKGGVGKTTIAVNLTAWLHLYGYKVVLADCDAQRLSSRWLGEALPEIPTVIFSSPEQIIKGLPQLLTEHDVVVADGPAGMEEVSRAILLRAHAVLIPAKASKLELNALALATETVREVQDIREGKPVAVVVANQVNEKHVLTRELIKESRKLGFPVANHVIHQKQIFAQAPGMGGQVGKILWQMGRSQRVKDAAFEIDALFQEIFPEVAEQDPTRLQTLFTETQPIKENHAETIHTANA
ncbi:MAG: AAA family ATPase [Pirellulaceae bacterium]